MTLFRAPEIAARFGALDDEAFQDGSPGDAHVVRELVRSGNLLASRAGLMYRAVYRSSSTVEGVGSALSYAPPFWQHMSKTPVIPVRKKYGVRSARVRMRLYVSTGHSILVFVGTSVRSSPIGAPLGDLVKVGGDVAQVVIDFEVPTREARGEVLSFYYKAVIDPTNDPLMATGTYGTPNTGVVDGNGAFDFIDTGAAWNATGANQPHLGGHYVYFSDASGNTPVHGPAEIRATISATSLGIYPPVPNNQALRGSTYTIHKLPAVQVVSVACYGVDRSA